MRAHLTWGLGHMLRAAACRLFCWQGAVAGPQLQTQCSSIPSLMGGAGDPNPVSPECSHGTRPVGMSLRCLWEGPAWS